MEHLLSYWLPLIPLGVRALVITVYFGTMRVPLKESQQARESHRALLLPLATLSFTGLFALVVVSKERAGDYSLPIYFLLVSFLAYLFAVNFQGYKNLRWHDQVGDALAEMGLLCLLASVASIAVRADIETFVRTTVVASVFAGWALDFAIRIVLEFRYLKLLQGGEA
jgi:hypothetical protein